MRGENTIYREEEEIGARHNSLSKEKYEDTFQIQKIQEDGEKGGAHTDPKR